ncbi:hypothetical protein K7X08_026273 [Anisodus acutangulus]|uniref:HD-Zip IV C-terminal domain-containing protein n=1 Tax=Anisodus acutangulus TaxID=402998 RepID=A0A9Q1N5Z1_9SOLA|nr:hypothetical protein K7X08_026273 [Anisodus acutangulus]
MTDYKMKSRGSMSWLTNFWGPSASSERSTTFMMTNFDLGFYAKKNATGGKYIVDAASPMEIDFRNYLSSPLPVISPWLTTNLINNDVTYDKSMLMDLALAFMNELLKLASIGEPLWIRSLFGGEETMNQEEYVRSFTRFTFMKTKHFTTEATRAVGTVFINNQTLETLMNKVESMGGNVFMHCGKTSAIDVISSCTGGSRSVYATIDSLAMNAVMNGGDSSCVALLPFGIAIVPDCCQHFSGVDNCKEISGKKDIGLRCSGSLMTIGFQVLVNNSPATKFSMESVKSVKNLISRIIHEIKTALKCK